MKKIIFLVVFTMYLFGNAQNQSKKISTFNLENKVAIQGYDPVAYFKQNKAIKGKKEITAVFDGIIYHFSSTTNKEFFSKKSFNL